MRKFLPAVALALVASGASAQSTLGIARPFNAFIFGNVNTPGGGEMEGPLAAGGNWASGAFNVNFKAGTTGYSAATVNATTNIGAYVKGAVSSTGSTSVTDDAYVGSASGTPLLFQGGGSQHSGVTDIFSPTAFLNQSNFLANLASQTAMNTSDQNSINIDLSAAANATQQSKYGAFRVYSIPASQLAANRTLNISNFGANTLVINVTGENGNTLGNVGGFGLQVTSGNFNHILWNDPNAIGFTIDGRIFEGSLLAPNAAVTQRNVIEGNLIAASLTDSGSNELHFGFANQFNGTLYTPSAPSTTPEPGVVGLMIAGLISGSVLFRRRKTARN